MSAARAADAPVLAAGEALFDFFSDPSGPADAAGALGYLAAPGGSPFNLAIGLARLGRRVAYFGALSTDALGERLAARLRAEGVAQALPRRSGRPTAISLVTLGADGEPSYAFYGASCADRDVAPGDAPADPARYAAIHLGSYALVAEPFAAALDALTAKARALGAGAPLIALDPNIRIGVEPEIELWRARVAAQAARADIVKASLEDLALLAPGRAPEAAAEAWLAGGARLVAITAGAEGATLWSRRDRARLRAVETRLVDSVGAGDAFQAALIDGALAASAPLQDLKGEALTALLRRCLRAAALCCGRRGADPPRRAELDAPRADQMET